MKRYEAKWFSGVEWAWLEVEVLAENEQQVREFIDTRTAAEYRNRPFRLNRKEVEYEDTLEIKELQEVILPYVLKEYR